MIQAVLRSLLGGLLATVTLYAWWRGLEAAYHPPHQLLQGVGWVVIAVVSAWVAAGQLVKAYQS